MASFENDALRCLYKQMLKLSKPKLIKLCKQYKIPHIGSKKEMSERLIQKHESKKKKKLKYKRRKVEGRKKSKQKVTKNVRSKQISPKTESINHKMQIKPYQPRILRDALLIKGYKRKEQIVPTLQGEVFIASKTPLHRDYVLIYGFLASIMHDDDISMHLIVICDICYLYYNYFSSVVIKRANKLHYCSVLFNENIIRESELMAMFMDHNAPKSMIKYIDFFEDERYYYLVLEKCGKGLFSFTAQCHKWILMNKLSIKEWIKCVGIIFALLCECIEWLHCNARCSHLDLSLENVVIGNDTYFDEKEGLIKNLNIRLIDFGLTTRFEIDNIDCICNKFVGKTGYKAPEVYNCTSFNAQKADIWSLGVCLFMLSIGAPPYNKPILSDKRYQILCDGEMKKLLIGWNRWHYVCEEQFELIMKMMCIEPTKRLSIKQVKQHKWIKPYFIKLNTINIIESNTIEYCDTNYFAAVNDNQ